MVVLDGVVKVESSRRPVSDGAARGTGHGQKDPRMSGLHDGAGEGVGSSKVLTSESQKTVNAASSTFHGKCCGSKSGEETILSVRDIYAEYSI